MGYVDLHCHLLWELDDGCASSEETLEAARYLVGHGYSDAAPSPHVQERYRGGDERCCRERLGEAQRLLEEAGVALELHPGAENMFDEEFIDRARSGAWRGIGDSRYALVEVPFLDLVPRLGDLVRAARGMGVIPLLAHPERCVEFVRPGRAEEMAREGAFFQLNLGALIGRHGRHAQSAAERFLDRGLYAVVGTDLHSPEQAESWIGDALSSLAERAGEAAVRRLCEENPRRVLAGQPLA
jgi:protein-tyrosine phosphatase